MSTQVYLGEPPAHIRQWIIEHSTPPAPAGHPETRFTLEGGTVETYNITGTLDQQWMIDNGYWDDENYEWLKTITQVDIGNTVMSIGDLVFQGCNSLTSVMIPDSVTNIKGSAFSSCTNLTSVTIGNGVIEIGAAAFSSCSGLTSMTIPNSVTNIGGDVFSECPNLMSLTFQGKTLAQVQEMDNYPWGIEDTSIINVA